MQVEPKARPAKLEGSTTKLTTGCGHLYLTVNRDGDKPFEIFMALGKSGSCTTCLLGAIARVISLALRCGLDILWIARQLEGIQCPNPIWHDGEWIKSCLDAVAKALKEQTDGSQNPD